MTNVGSEGSRGSQPYRIPPVVEAVIGVQLFPHLTQREVERVRDRLKRRLPSIQVNNNIRIDVAASGVTSANIDANSFVLRSKDGIRFAVLQREGWSAGFVAPYPGWDALEEEFETTFDSIKSIIGSRTTTRIGCRYTNRVDIPSAVYERHGLSGMFTVLKTGYDEKQFAFKGLASNIHFRHIESDTDIIINFANVMPVLIGFESVVLDIDVAFNNISEINKENMLERLPQLRNIKNLVFEQSITDVVRELIK